MTCLMNFGREPMRQEKKILNWKHLWEMISICIRPRLMNLSFQSIPRSLYHISLFENFRKTMTVPKESRISARNRTLWFLDLLVVEKHPCCFTFFSNAMDSYLSQMRYLTKGKMMDLVI